MASNQTTIDRQSVIVRLTLMIGACRMPRITKKQIEASLQAYLKELGEDEGEQDFASRMGREFEREQAEAARAK
jgi:hypothetical protein